MSRSENSYILCVYYKKIISEGGQQYAQRNGDRVFRVETGRPHLKTNYKIIKQQPGSGLAK